MIAKGFGFTFDVKSGIARNWYMGSDGVKRWADNDQLVEVECFKCGKTVPYSPPYPPDQFLCDSCSEEIGEMMRKGEL